MNRVRYSLAAISTLQNHPGKPEHGKVKKSKQSQFSGYIHALVMLFCFAILLGTTYTEQQPYVYSSSHQALMIAIKQSEALSVATIEDIWTWVLAVVSTTGGEGIDSINANCQYDVFNSQEVVIDGVSYTLGKPSYDTSACDENDISFVTGSMNEVYLTGNHQLLSFGLFTMRSVPQYPVQNSVKNAKKSLIKVRGTEVAPLDPLRDDKVVEVCDANWGKCLHRDGFNGDAGSTFNWQGRVVGDYYTFQEGSQAYMILPPTVTAPVTVNPCFTFHEVGPTSSPTEMPSTPGPPLGDTGGDTGGGTGDTGGDPPPNRRLASSSDGKYIAQPGNPSWAYNISNVTLTNCEYKWISTGYTIRETCLGLSNTKPIPIVAYLARRQNYDDVLSLMNSYFGCTSLFSVSSDKMKTLYVTGDKSLESNILGDRAYGVFFSTANQDMWIRQSVEGTVQLQAHKYIDENTRVVRLYFITRSLGREQLFYTIITVEYLIGVDGNIQSSITATYVPMIMFQYGYDHYEWRVKDVYRFEIMLLIIFVLFTSREIYQLITRRLVWLLPDRVRELLEGEKKKKSSDEEKAKEGQIKKKPVSMPRPAPVDTSASAAAPVVRGARVGIASPVRAARVGIIPVRPSTVQGAGGTGNNNYGPIPVMTNDEGMAQSRSSSADQPQQSEGKQDDRSVTPVVDSDQFIAHKPSQLLVSEPSDRNDVEQLVEEMNELVDELGDAIEDIIDDYTPDSAGVHDMLDWITIAVITIGIIYRVNYVKSAAALHTYLMNQEEERTYDEHMEQIVAKFADIQSQDQAIHLIAIAVIAVGMLQFFRYLSFNKRFGIVTTTIAASTGDLLPVLVIFVSIVIAYAILASEIYGIQMEEYSTVQSSLAALFIVLLGNFDYYSSKLLHALTIFLFVF
jgi:hypothetical protein